MRIEVKMPSWGMGMESAVLLEWVASVGDTVTEGSPIAVIQTDKADGDVDAPASGTFVETLAAPGDDIATGATIAIIET
jgi:pyruvate/2-oxoglutarate dehydrogenase complex dihydrolipoamide acyltransferase (E2) component